MFIFETYLKEVKHEVLKQIAILAKEDRLNNDELFKIHKYIVDKDKPKTRCCVYKERAIVHQRAKLAAGYLPVGDDSENLIDIKGDKQIIYIIEAACDRCQIDKYTVTEACRGCLAKKCSEICPTGAITKVGRKSYINQDLCKECGLCKKVCPYDAISEVLRPCKVVCPTGALNVNTEDRRAIIDENYCIQCGACMSACPFGAISDKSLIATVAKELGKDTKFFAVVAPSIAGQFGQTVTMGQIKTALKNIGFEDMIEAACGADVVTVNEAQEFVHRKYNGEKYMTNSCCPGFYSYIEKKFSSEAGKISNTVSPMIATAKMIKQAHEDCKVVFIGPCTAKKAEAERYGLKGFVDYVLTFEELSALLDANEMDPENCIEDIIEDGSVYGRGFGMAGGLTAAIENYLFTENIKVTFKPIKVNGHVQIKKVMSLAKAGKLDGNFIEGMMCEDGCIGGAATIIPPSSSKNAFMKEASKSRKKSVVSNENINNFHDINLER